MRSESCLFKEDGWGYFQCGRNSVDVVEAYIALTALDATDVGSVEADLMSEGLLREAAFLAKCANRRTELFAMVVLCFTCPCHALRFR